MSLSYYFEKIVEVPSHYLEGLTDSNFDSPFISLQIMIERSLLFSRYTKRTELCRNLFAYNTEKE